MNRISGLLYYFRNGVMMSSLSNRLSLEGKSLRNKLAVISTLIFLIPFLVVCYIFYRADVFQNLDYLSLIIFALLLLLILAGMIILRQIFDKFITIAIYTKKIELGEMVIMEAQKDTAELHDISTSFNNILLKLGETSKSLEEQTADLQKEIGERRRAEEALKESEKRYNNLLEVLNEYIKEKISEKQRPL